MLRLFLRLKSERPNMSNLHFLRQLRCYVCMVALLLIAACDRPNSDLPPTAASVSETFEISMQLDFQGQGENLNLEIEAPKTASVFELLQIARSQGELEFESIGSGKLAFVTSINGIENEKAGGSNWVFFVNDQLGNTGSGDYKLNESDKVLWKFKPNGLK